MDRPYRVGLVVLAAVAAVTGEFSRTLILDCTLGVVLFTLLVQGTTIGRLAIRTGRMHRRCDEVDRLAPPDVRRH